MECTHYFHNQIKVNQTMHQIHQSLIFWESKTKQFFVVILQNEISSNITITLNGLKSNFKVDKNFLLNKHMCVYSVHHFINGH